MVRGRRRLKWGNFWLRRVGYIPRHHHCRFASGTGSEVSSLLVLYLKPIVMRSDEMGELLVADAPGLYTRSSSLPVRLWNRQ
jgi:hypothetical protein